MTGYRERRLAEMRPYVEKARRMSGWTFDVEMSPLGPPMPWDYAERARELLADAASVLDIGTGGGERFSRILQGYDKRAVAMEGWSGNIRVAVDHLGKIGVPVVYGSGNLLPFRDTSFEVVLNRHEGFSPEDASRIAAAGGRVLTQQVGHDNWKEFADFFPGRQPSWGPTFGPYQEGFHRSGLRVLRADWHESKVAVATLDDVAYLLTAVPWVVRRFNLEGDLDTLLELERELTSDNGIVLTQTRYIIEALKGSG